ERCRRRAVRHPRFGPAHPTRSARRHTSGALEPGDPTDLSRLSPSWHGPCLWALPVFTRTRSLGHSLRPVSGWGPLRRATGGSMGPRDRVGLACPLRRAARWGLLTAAVIFGLTAPAAAANVGFASAQGGQFMLNGQPYRFVSTNAYFLLDSVNYG